MQTGWQVEFAASNLIKNVPGDWSQNNKEMMEFLPGTMCANELRAIRAKLVGDQIALKDTDLDSISQIDETSNVDNLIMIIVHQVVE